MTTSKKSLRLTKYGFKRAKQHNFSDDGTYFFGYEFEGVRTSYARKTIDNQDKIFLCIHKEDDDKLEKLGYELFDKYNGFDMEKFNPEEFGKWVEEAKEAIAKARAQRGRGERGRGALFFFFSCAHTYRIRMVRMFFEGIFGNWVGILWKNVVV